MRYQSAEGLSAAEVKRKTAIVALLLSGVAVSFFLVSALSARMEAWRSRLALQASRQGRDDLSKARYQQAMERFQTALRYERDNGGDTLGLAQSLIGVGRSDEARPYLLSLHERDPENGLADLELARLSAAQNNYPEAKRYYQSAVHSAWRPQQVSVRRQARAELIQLLLQHGEAFRAQAEIMAMAANAADDTPTLLRAAAFFTLSGDRVRALAVSRQALARSPGDMPAILQTASAAYDLGQYAEAVRLYRQAQAAAALDAKGADQLELAEQVLRLDPYQRRLGAAERAARVRTVYRKAGDDLRLCAAAASSPGWSALQQGWSKLSRSVSLGALERDRDLEDAVLAQSFAIERQAAASCSQAQPDRALLRLAQSHQEPKDE